MPHHTPLISTLAVALALALALGFVAVKLRLPALVGYLLAGVMIGPFTPGFVADTAIAAELAEIGVMLLMFGVGLHFSMNDLLAVRRIAIPGAVLQIAVATALGVGLALFWGWELGGALVFGLSLSVASTVVLLRALEANGSLPTLNGKIAVGWLIVEDLAMVLALVLLPPLAHVLGATEAPSSVNPASASSLWAELGLTLMKVAGFIAFMLLVGRRLFPATLWKVAQTHSRELFTLCVIAAAVSIAYAAATLFGVSLALGAFFAGMVMRESEFSHRAAEESLPLREAFAVLFFVSVGMLFDPKVLLERPLQVLAVVGIIVVGKSLAAAALVLALRHPVHTALTVSASLAQIGEFSFILIGLGASLGLLPAEAQSLVLAGALISIALNPLLFGAIPRLEAWLTPRLPRRWVVAPLTDPLTELPSSTHERFLSGQVVLVGFGRLGQKIAASLTAQHIPFVVAELNRERVEQLRANGMAAVAGDATEPEVLIQAHIQRASMLVVTLPDVVHTQTMLDTARLLNPHIEAVTLAHNEEEAQRLQTHPTVHTFLKDHELAKGMALHIQTRFGREKDAKGKWTILGANE